MICAVVWVKHEPEILREATYNDSRVCAVCVKFLEQTNQKEAVISGQDRW